MPPWGEIIPCKREESRFKVNEKDLQCMEDSRRVHETLATRPRQFCLDVEVVISGDEMTKMRTGSLSSRILSHRV